MRFSGHAYPWDVLGDPEFIDRVRALGVEEVTLAAAYHSTRAATPAHPAHQIVDAPGSALYRPVRESIWSGARLRPVAAEWMDSHDPYREAAEQLHAAGIRVRAWVVINHDSRLGRAQPALAVTNCFGDSYSYALCPANPEVRHYAARLATEAVREAPVDAVSLEGCGQLGLAHVGSHEKTEGTWSPEAKRWLSVCCCPACRGRWRQAGWEPHEITAALRDAVARDHAVPPEMAATVLRVRHDSFDRLRTEVTHALRDTVGAVPIVLHADPDPWATGPASGLTATTHQDVDGLLVPAWSTSPESVRTVALAAGTGLPVDAYVTVLPPVEPDTVLPHVRRLVTAGAGGLAFYHLGLANAPRRRLIGEALASFS